MNPPPPPKAEFLYSLAITGQPANPGIHLTSFKVDPSAGTLSSTSTTTLSQISVGLAVDPAAKSLYLSDPGLANVIDIFSIDANTGVPTPTGVYQLTTLCALCPPESGPGFLALNPNGKYLYYGSATLGLTVTEGVGAIGVNAATGALSSITGSPFTQNDAPLFLAVHPSGQFVYAENLDKTGAGGLALQSISGFFVEPATGALTPVPQSPFPAPSNAGVSGFAVHPSGKFLYAGTGLAANGILAWSIDSTTGALTVLPNSPLQPGAEMLSVAFDPSGKFLYASAGPTGGIAGFTVDPTSGDLIPLSTSPFAAGSTLASLVVDPSGQFLFAGDTLNKAIVVFKVDATTGTLAPLGGPTLIGASTIFMSIVKAP